MLLQLLVVSMHNIYVLIRQSRDSREILHWRDDAAATVNIAITCTGNAQYKLFASVVMRHPRNIASYNWTICVTMCWHLQSIIKNSKCWSKCSWIELNLVSVPKNVSTLWNNLEYLALIWQEKFVRNSFSPICAEQLLSHFSLLSAPFLIEVSTKVRHLLHRFIRLLQVVSDFWLH